MTPVPDPIFASPRLARIYDALDADRSDLGHYVDRIEAFGARSVLDVGCGTGVFAGLLAAKGIEVTGVDPSVASLDVARNKPTGGRVRWLVGDAAILPPLAVDGPALTIRKFSRTPYGVEDLIGFRTLSPEVASFIDTCVKARISIMISGGTGSGKTT